MTSPREIIEGDGGFIVIRYDGGRSNDSVLDLASYATSLNGWSNLFKLLGSIYHNSSGDAQFPPGKPSLQIDVRAERRGSYEILIWIGLVVASGVLSNRSDAVFVWTYKNLISWYKKSIESYVSAKRSTRNIDEIVASLEMMASQQNVILRTDVPAQTDDLQIESSLDPEPYEVVREPKRALVEKIDLAIRDATNPLDHECENIRIENLDGPTFVELSKSDREVIKESLTLPPPEGVWRQQLIKFERINRKTGRALVYFGEDPIRHAESAIYSKIMDSDVHKPGNPYTRSFDSDIPLKVWARQVRGERGRLNLMWEITVQQPEQLALFGPEGGRA